MSPKKIFAIVFQSIQALIALAVVLMFIDLSWVIPQVLAGIVLVVFLIFINVITWSIILSPEKKENSEYDEY